ncbi:hypothetical protein BC567DRAFT_59106 [Phyllosticta citribraziliensis]
MDGCFDPRWQQTLRSAQVHALCSRTPVLAWNPSLISSRLDMIRRRTACRPRSPASKAGGRATFPRGWGRADRWVTAESAERWGVCGQGEFDDQAMRQFGAVRLTVLMNDEMPGPTASTLSHRRKFAQTDGRVVVVDASALLLQCAAAVLAGLDTERWS